MSFSSLLFWYGDRPAWLRSTLAAVAAAVLYAGGCLAVVEPATEDRREARSELEELRERARIQRERLAAYTPPDPELESRLARAADSLAPPDSLRRLGLESEVLTALSQIAEEAGVAAPIFNPAAGGAPSREADRLPLLSIHGRFRADLRAVAGFVGGLGSLPTVTFLDSLAVARDSAGPRVTVVLRAMRARPGKERGRSQAERNGRAE